MAFKTVFSFFSSPILGRYEFKWRQEDAIEGKGF